MTRRLTAPRPLWHHRHHTSDDESHMRTIIDIPPEQSQQLAELCRQQRLSRAEAVRRAIALLLASQPQSAGDAFGLWKGRADGVSYQQSIRDEWGG
jgi:Spy/CpxP family protein refolding chaperone